MLLGAPGLTRSNGHRDSNGARHPNGGPFKSRREAVRTLLQSCESQEPEAAELRCALEHWLF